MSLKTRFLALFGKEPEGETAEVLDALDADVHANPDTVPVAQPVVATFMARATQHDLTMARVVNGMSDEQIEAALAKVMSPNAPDV